MKRTAALALGLAALAGMSGAQTAAETYKNVVVLKDAPANQWGATMALISGSLGVGCTHCHDQALESDAKPAKTTARNMIRMVQEINARSFGGRAVVTCNTCHQGNARPNRIPAIWNKTPEQVD